MDACTLIVWGQTHIASGFTSILNATTPLFTVTIAQVFTDDEKLTGGRLGGIIIGPTEPAKATDALRLTDDVIESLLLDEH